eukprot:5000-Hanusia_phi.AAC.1
MASSQAGAPAASSPYDAAHPSPCMPMRRGRALHFPPPLVASRSFYDLWSELDLTGPRARRRLLIRSVRSERPPVPYCESTEPGRVWQNTHESQCMAGPRRGRARPARPRQAA